MSAPPLLLGAALLFWGWETRWLVVAVPLAVLVELPRALRTRWEVSPEDFSRVWNLCAFAFVGAFVYSLWANEGVGYVGRLFQDSTPGERVAAFNKTTRSVLIFFQWLPMIFFPFLLVQRFSTRSTIDFSTFSLFARRRRARLGSAWRGSAIDVTYPYLAVVLVASGAGNHRSLAFFAGASVLVVWALWPQRSRRYSPAVWAALVMMATGLGFANAMGLEALERVVENVRFEWLSSLLGSRTDQTQSRTALGSIGRLKLSGRIVLRVETEGRSAPPLLREASYDAFFSETRVWRAQSGGFLPLPGEPDGQTWQLQAQRTPTNWVRVARYLAKGQGLLVLPPGPVRLEELPVVAVETNRFGAAKVDGGPGLVRYLARFRDGRSLDGPPTTNDLAIPPEERPALEAAAAEMGLGFDSSNAVRETLRTVNRFFQQRFSYSLNLRGMPVEGTNRTALSDFLRRTRTGHCEYFATATVLLLRQAGVPARYAVGYVAHEGSGGRYVVRERDAHAWCLAWVDGAWRELDNTPASWREIEAQNASLWEPAYDLLSRLWFEFSKWRWGQTTLRPYLIWLLVGAGVVVVLRVIRQGGWKRVRGKPGTMVRRVASPAGADSEFYRIEERLAARGFGRRPDETMNQWLKRLRASAVVADTVELEPLLGLHYRLRFDPAGLPPTERANLASRTAAWLARNSSRQAGKAAATPR
jgi:transglutaminase-like putative cysteine protease